MIQGVYLEHVSIHSDTFKEFSQRFGNKLSSLYEVNFTELDNGYLGDATEWEATAFYHGTTHCGCVDQRVYNDDNAKISVQDWCMNSYCSTRGIMTNGHLRAKLAALEGHFFSPVINIARSFAQTRSRLAGRPPNYLSIFICIARKILSSSNGAHFYYVQNDCDILPVFLAIVQI